MSFLSAVRFAVFLAAFGLSHARAGVTPIVGPLATSGFTFSFGVDLPGAPEVIFDAFTGDVRDWWDHSWSDKPKALYIEPKPGGGFYEIFDDSGNGALHATVITAHRGRLLRMDGPLGLAGNAVTMVTTLEFEAKGQDSTLLTLTVNATGQIDEKMAGTVENVWRHFLIDQFKPYLESGRHLERKTQSK